MTHEQRITEIREREQKATAGPWIMGIDVEDGNGTAERVMSIDCGNSGTPVLGEVYNPDQIDEDNAIFIAHARSDIPFLLKHLDTLAAECLRLREERIELKRTIAFAYLYFVSKTTEAEEKELGRQLAKHYDPAFRQFLDAAKEVPLMNTLHPEIHKAAEPALLAEIAKPLSVHSEQPGMSPCDHDECPPNVCTRNAAKEAK